jgi:hypothetical protein
MFEALPGILVCVLIAFGVPAFLRFLSRKMDEHSSTDNTKNVLSAYEDCKKKGGYVGIAPNGQKIFFPDTEAYVKFDEERTKREQKYHKR